MTAAKRNERDAAARKGTEAEAAKARPPEAKVKPPARGPLITRLHKTLRAYYRPIEPNVSRPLLDQVLFACCLENSPADAAEKAFARLKESAFDLNEVRVTTVAELAETLSELPDPARAALALRRVLQSVFESTYTFSLDHARKHSLAHGIRTLEQLHGTTPFVINYVAATGMGGHFLPLDLGALSGLYLCGIITQQEYDSGKVIGLERTIGKKAATEFSSLLHQFGVECLTNLHGATVRKIVTSVNPAAKDRFPKRGEPLVPPAPPPPPTVKQGQKEADAARQSAEAHRPAGPQAAARPAGKTPMPPPGAGPKRPGDGKGAGGKPGPKPFVVKPNIGKPITIKSPPPEPAPKPAAKKAEAAKPVAPKPAAGKPQVGKTPAGRSSAGRPTPAKPASPAPSKQPPRKAGGKHAAREKGHSRQLAKRKPR
jgi:hypothetical protein